MDRLTVEPTIHDSVRLDSVELGSFDPDTAAALIESGWWEWPHETIRERLQDFTGSTEKFIELYAKRSGEAGR